MSIVLLDADGVLCDFVGAYLRVLNRFAGTALTAEDVTAFDFFDSPKFGALLEDIPQLKSWMDHYITHTRGFALELNPLPGARDGVHQLRDAGNKVYCVTSPWAGSEHWHHERAVWLQTYMGFSKHEIVFASDKSIVSGNVLVDDKIGNLTSWKHGRGLLWDQPWNRTDPSAAGLPRAKTWDQVLGLCRCWRQGK